MVATETPSAELGWPAPHFKLPGVDGAEHSFDDCRGERGLVVMFICNHCPYVKASLARIARDARALLEHGVRCVAISSNDAVAHPDDSFAHMRRVAREQDLPFPYLYDESQSVARAYGAVCTPDFFGFNAAGLLQYRGRLDAGRIEAPPIGAPRELYEAMRLVAATGKGPAGRAAAEHRLLDQVARRLMMTGAAGDNPHFARRPRRRAPRADISQRAAGGAAEGE